MNAANKRVLKIYTDKGFEKYSTFAMLTGLSHQTASNYLKGENGGAVYLYIDNVNGEAVVDQRIEGTWTAVGETLRTNFKGVTETFVNKNGVYTSKVSEKRTLVKIP